MEVSSRVQACPGPLGSKGKGLTGDCLQLHHQRGYLGLRLFILAWRERPQAGQERRSVGEGDGSDYPASLLQVLRKKRSAGSSEAAASEVDTSKLPPLASGPASLSLGP